MARKSELYKLQASYENFTTLTVSRNTAVRYAKALTTFLDRFPDRREPDEFTRRDVEDYKIWRMREGLNPRTVNYEVSIVRAFWNWMLDQELVTWNPATKVKRLKEKEPIKTSLTIPEQLQLQKGCYNWGDHALVALALTTGLRGETLALLEKSEINFDEARLVIPATKMKAGRNHEIPLPTWVLNILKDAPDGYIFAKYAKNANSIRYRWNAICRRAGVAPKGIRTARRTFATTLLRGGADLKLVQDLLGHRSVLTTSRYLTPADSDTTRAAVDKLPNPEKELDQMQLCGPVPGDPTP
jgi:integrase